MVSLIFIRFLFASIAILCSSVLNGFIILMFEEMKVKLKEYLNWSEEDFLWDFRYVNSFGYYVI